MVVRTGLWCVPETGQRLYIPEHYHNDDNGCQDDTRKNGIISDPEIGNGTHVDYGMKEDHLRDAPAGVEKSQTMRIHPAIQIRTIIVPLNKRSIWLVTFLAILL